MPIVDVQPVEPFHNLRVICPMLSRAGLKRNILSEIVVPLTGVIIDIGQYDIKVSIFLIKIVIPDFDCEHEMLARLSGEGIEGRVVIVGCG